MLAQELTTRPSDLSVSKDNQKTICLVGLAQSILLKNPHHMWHNQTNVCHDTQTQTMDCSIWPNVALKEFSKMDNRSFGLSCILIFKS